MGSLLGPACGVSPTNLSEKHEETLRKPKEETRSRRRYLAENTKRAPANAWWKTLRGLPNKHNVLLRLRCDNNTLRHHGGPFGARVRRFSDDS